MQVCSLMWSDAEQQTRTVSAWPPPCAVLSSSKSPRAGEAAAAKMRCEWGIHTQSPKWQNESLPCADSTEPRTWWLHTPVGLLRTGWAAEQGGNSFLGHSAQDFSQQDPCCGVNYDASPMSDLLICISLWITSPGAQKALPTSLSSHCLPAPWHPLPTWQGHWAAWHGPMDQEPPRQILRWGSAAASPPWATTTLLSTRTGSHRPHSILQPSPCWSWISPAAPQCLNITVGRREPLELPWQEEI